MVGIQGADDDAADAGVVGYAVRAGGLGSVAGDGLVGHADGADQALGLEISQSVQGALVVDDPLVGADFVASYGGEVQVLDRVEDCSTTAILDRIVY